jgi:hypothetical protein
VAGIGISLARFSWLKPTNVNGIMLEVFQYYVRHEADFLYEIDEENAA